MINADRIIASLIIISSLYFMWHAIALPIGWNGIEGGPGGGAFPFWLSFVMLICSGIIFWRSSSGTKFQKFSFDTSNFYLCYQMQNDKELQIVYYQIIIKVRIISKL